MFDAKYLLDPTDFILMSDKVDTMDDDNSVVQQYHQNKNTDVSTTVRNDFVSEKSLGGMNLLVPLDELKEVGVIMSKIDDECTMVCTVGDMHDFYMDKSYYAVSIQIIVCISILFCISLHSFVQL